MKKIERCARFFYKVIFGNTLYLQQIIRQIAHFRKCTKSMDNKFGAILHVLQKRNIWMKNKKECRSTDRSVLCRK